MNSLRCCRRLLRVVLLVSLSYCLLLVMCAPAGSAQRRERWQWPTLSPVPVASSFAPPVHDWLPGRRGVTLTYPGGSPVYACASGTVTFAGQVGGRGPSAHPFAPDRLDAGDWRLLTHDLEDEGSPIGHVVVSHRQVALIGCEPAGRSWRSTFEASAVGFMNTLSV